MTIQRKRVAKRLASGLLAGALALGGLAISGSSVSAKTPNSPTTNRLSGDDRYETAVAIARLHAGDAPKALIIASGESYADALAASSLAAGALNPVATLLVRKDSIPASVADYISDIRGNFAALAAPPVYVIGGTSVVSAEVEAAIKAALAVPADTAPASIVRRGGDDRYGTAKSIGEVTGLTSYDDTMILVGGDNWADALSAGALAAKTGWPIALVPQGGIASNASTKAQVDAYIALTSSVKKFLILGGPAAVPSSVEEYLAGTKSIAPGNIRRIAGADRYMTSILANVYLAFEHLGGAAGVIPGGASTWNTNKVALASGESPWDALAASGWAGNNGVHVMLTPTKGGNVFTTGLGAAIAGLAVDSSVGLLGNVLYILGGKAAVSDDAKTGYVASMANSLTSTLSGCDSGRNAMTLTLSGGLSAAEYAQATAAMATKFTSNGTPLAVTVSAVSLPGVPENTILDVELTTSGATISATQAIKFLGVPEAANPTNNPSGWGSSMTRAIAGAECVVAADTVKPVTSGTPRAWSGNAGNASVSAFMHVKFSEPVLLGNGVTMPAGSLRILSTGATNSAAASVSGMNGDAAHDSYATEWMIALAAGDGGIPTVTGGATPAVLVLETAAVKDQAGLSPALPIPATAGDDAATPATLTTAAVACGAKEVSGVAVNATMTSGVTIAVGGDYEGAAGNSWSMTVTNQRGLLIPTVTADTTAKTITIVADTAYHKASDIATAMQNNLLANAVLGDFAVSGGSTAVAATVVPAKATGGRSICDLLIVSNEPIAVGTGSASDASASVNNTPVIAISDAVGADYVGAAVLDTVFRTATVITIETSQLGAGAILFNDSAAGVSDVRGSRTLTAVGFTAS